MFDDDVGENQIRKFADVLRFSRGCHLVSQVLSALSPLVSGFPHWWLLASLLVSRGSKAPLLLVFRHGFLETLVLWTGTKVKVTRATTLQLVPLKSRAIVDPIYNIYCKQLTSKRIKQTNITIQGLSSLIMPSVTINITRFALAESSQSLLTK